MTRSLVSLLPLLALGFAASAAAEPDAALPAPMPVAVLKSGARIDDAQVRLGDLFDNAGEHAGDVVAAAPAPGQTLLFPTAWLALAAQRAGLAWQPPSPYATIRVDRAATEFDAGRIGQALAQSLGVAPPNFRIMLDGQPRLYGPVGGDPHLEIGHVDLDKASGRVTADLHVASAEGDGASIHVSAQVEAMVELPVLARPLAIGTVIRPQDLTTSWQRADFVQANEITDETQLIGRAPRHPLRANQPLVAADIEVPTLVKRNDRVLIVLESPGMVLTAEGKALEDGGAGAMIRVANAQSNRPLDAVVLAAGRVAARSPDLLAAGL